MGYRPKHKTYVLEFEDPDMHGLEVRARSTSLGALVEIEALPPDEAGIRLIELLAECLISWNVEDKDGNPVPADLAGLHAQDPAFVGAVCAAWQNAVNGVSAPLDESSPSGGQSLALSMPMETLSADLVS